MSAIPGGITPAMLAPARAPEQAVSDSQRFGRVEPDGTVYLVRPSGEVRVGQWVAGTPAQGLAFYARRYDDLVVEIDLLTRRLAEGRGSIEDALALSGRAKASIETPDFVGDVDALAIRVERLTAAVDERRVAAQAEKAARKAEAEARRTALVTEAESLAASTQWKTTGERFTALVEEWKAVPRGDRSSEQALWKRFSAARNSFERKRKAHFSHVDSERKEAVSAKEAIIAEAERLSTSTDWVATAKAYRTLVDRWKAAPRAQRHVDDKLWARFKAAQDAFFDARTASAAEAEAALAPNVEAKLALVAEAEALLPITDAKTAKQSLRSIQSRWDAAKASGDGAKVAKAEKALASSQPLLDAAKRALAEFGG